MKASLSADNGRPGMGINFDELKEKATGALRDNSEKIEHGLDKAAQFAKSKVSGHDSQIDGGVEKAKGFLGKMGGKHETGEHKGGEPDSGEQPGEGPTQPGPPPQ
ncbi:antitoxin [Amycolatopsis sulphurea]